MSAPADDDQHMFHALDALRGVAAIAVAFGHFGDIASRMVYYPSGYLPVDFFFCLSGFVIAHAYERRLREGLHPLRLMSLRLIRLYPYYLLGSVVGLLQWVIYRFRWTDPVSQAVSPWAFLWAIFSSIVFIPSKPLSAMSPELQYPFNNSAWSLFFELAANALYAVLLYRFRSVALAAVLFCFAAGLWAVAFAHGNLNGSFDLHFLLGTARVGYSFLVGVLLRRLWKPGYVLKVPFGWFAAALVATFIIPVHGIPKAAYDLGMVYFAFPAIVFCGAILRDGDTYVGKIWRKIGIASYGMYALQFPVVLLIKTLAPGIGANCSRAASMGFATIFVAALGAIIVRLDADFDRPLRRRLRTMLARGSKIVQQPD